MNEGETSGAQTPVGASQDNETPVAAPVFSAGAEGSSTDASSSTSVNGLKIPGFRARSRRNTSARVDADYAAAQRVANNPNTPEFFGDAMMAATPSEKPKRSKKPLIIGGALCCALAIVAVAVLVLGNSPIQQDKKSAADAHTLWLRYANLYLFEKDSDEDLPSEHSKSPFWGYSAKVIFNRIGKNNETGSEKDYFKTIREKYDAFKETFDKVDKGELDADSPLSEEAINDYSDRVHALVDLTNPVTISEEELFYKAKDNGIESARAFLEEKVGPLTQDTNQKKAAYYEGYSDRLKSEIDFYEYVQSVGCKMDSELFVCIENLDKESRDIATSKMEAPSKDIYEEKTVENLIYTLAMDCWKINDAIKEMESE